MKKSKLRNHAMISLTNEGGFGALIMVVWIVVMLMAIAGEFTYSMKTEINIMTNFKEEEEAYRLALAGIEKAKMELLLMKEPAYVYLNENSSLMLGEPEEDGEEVMVMERKGELETGSFTYTIADEEGKININTASQAQIRAILIESGVETEEVDTITDSIMDWRDGNDLHMLNGAEEDYYQSLDTPYSSKDGFFYVIEELLLVKGMSPEILYGLKGEEEDDDGEEVIYTGLIDFFTVVGSGRTNINTASETVLETLFGTDNALNIITQREAGPIKRPIAKGQVTSSYFTVMSIGTNRDGSITRTVKAVLESRNKRLETHYWNDNYTG